MVDQTISTCIDPIPIIDATLEQANIKLTLCEMSAPQQWRLRQYNISMTGVLASEFTVFYDTLEEGVQEFTQCLEEILTPKVVGTPTKST